MAREEGGKPNPTQIQKFLGGVDYPAAKDALVKHAKGQNAPEDIIRVLEKLPDRKYEGPTGIIEELY
jgi:hypothetical protein